MTAGFVPIPERPLLAWDWEQVISLLAPVFSLHVFLSFCSVPSTGNEDRICPDRELTFSQHKDLQGAGDKIW